MESDDEYWSDSSAPLNYDSDEFDFGKDDIIFPPSQDNMEAIQHEERDFLFEAIVILQKYNDLKTPPPRLWKISFSEGDYNRVRDQKSLPRSLQLPCHFLAATKRRRRRGRSLLDSERSFDLLLQEHIGCF